MINETPIKRPGLVLRDMFLRPLRIDVVSLHFMCGVPTFALTEIVAGRQGVDRRTAIALGESLGTGAEFWLELQNEYEAAQHAQRNDLLHEGVTKLLFAPKESDG